jgi:hypothetical protein
MKIKMLVLGKEHAYEIYGSNGFVNLEYVHYNSYPNNFDCFVEIYNNSKTMKRFMERMLKRYGRTVRNFT